MILAIREISTVGDFSVWPVVVLIVVSAASIVIVFLYPVSVRHAAAFLIPSKSTNLSEYR
jgi:hypothetical protein